VRAHALLKWVRDGTSIVCAWHCADDRAEASLAAHVDVVWLRNQVACVTAGAVPAQMAHILAFGGHGASCSVERNLVHQQARGLVRSVCLSRATSRADSGSPFLVQLHLTVLSLGTPHNPDVGDDAASHGSR